jgi:hypothetical protein
VENVLDEMRPSKKTVKSITPKEERKDKIKEKKGTSTKRSQEKTSGKDVVPKSKKTDKG